MLGWRNVFRSDREASQPESLCESGERYLERNLILQSDIVCHFLADFCRFVMKSKFEKANNDEPFRRVRPCEEVGFSISSKGRYFRHGNRLAEGNEKNPWVACHDDGHAFGSCHVSHGMVAAQWSWALVLNSDFLSFFGAEVNGFLEV